ncbi:hypothetical protein OG728_39020 (plasmid) [Streptomyces microflavus]|uniref:hypothetical protein n=1 Tax=Streptomyces microflavus TaxID=1919 RepID=UPI002E0F8D9B|nr:hypothetical protein OG728_39020 [Streptomyces microflavus]
MSTVDPREIIAKSLGGMLAQGRTYPRPLHPDIAPWYCYVLDGGHSILVSLDSEALADPPGWQDLMDNLVPAPVKAVERAGWRMVEGFPVSRLPYDPELGLLTEPGDDEFGEEAAPSVPAAKMAALAVGEPYPRQLPWRDGTCEIRINEHGVEFLLAFASPKPHEVKAFRQGNAEFALVPGQHHVMWAYKFTDPQDSNSRHGIPWSDQPWEYHRQAAVSPTGAPAGRGGSFPLQLVLVDADTGVVEALRLVGPPAEFADALRDAVDAQAAVPFDPAAADREIAAVYARCATTTDLVLSAVARWEALRDGTVR